MADRIEAVAIDGLGEIVPGDDLPALIASASRRAPSVLPLRDDDVLVVTQKVVSKAEGAVVDLTTIEPRAEAVEFAQRWDRDPRQVEVVLREAKRVVRMEQRPGHHRDPSRVRVRERRHRCVERRAATRATSSRCCRATRTPPPTGSAAAIRERLGPDLPVIVSDSFGRPWRFGIVDVAIGVSGLLPLDDLRGTPDADGRVMKSTVRAVADEIASAAELALGKTARRPLALVRGATFRRGEGRIADVVMPAEMDLFR